MSDIGRRLEELERLGLSRSLRAVSGPQGPRVTLDGEPVLLLCSNNYLGLADHERVREAAAQAAMQSGAGAGASRLVSGTMTIHARLEQRLAAFHHAEACVLFGSGYLANMGVIGALAGRGDTIYSDELNHASIIDGCRGSRARVVVYRHGDVEHLEWLMRRESEGHRHGADERREADHGRKGGEGREVGHGHGYKGGEERDDDEARNDDERRDRGKARDRGEGRRLIVTDAVFSMDGDVAPLRRIVELARRYDARTIVDEAHAIGALGPGGRGAVAQAGLEGEVDVVIGTLGKSLGSYGAYTCAGEEMVRYLINTARPLIFSTAPPPPSIAAALAALELLEEQPQRVQRLRANARELRRALAAEGIAIATEDVEMHIVPVIVGDERATVDLCEAALRRGVFAQAIRPPTVAAGTSRLRLAVMATHTPTELREAARTIARAARELGLDLAAASPQPAAPASTAPVAAATPTTSGAVATPAAPSAGATPTDPGAAATTAAEPGLARAA